MKLHSARFEADLRRRVKVAVAASPGLRAEARRARNLLKRNLPPWLSRLGGSLACGAGTYAIANAAGHPATALAALALWSFFFAVVQSLQLNARFGENSDTVALRALPVSPTLIFQWQWWKFLRGSGFSLLDLSLGLGALAWQQDLPPGKWLAIPLLAFLGWGCGLSLAVLLFLYVPILPRQLFRFLFTVGGVALFSLIKDSPSLLQSVNRDVVAPYVIEGLPTGWSLALFQLLLPGPRLALLLLLPPIAGILWLLQSNRDRLRDAFAASEETLVPVAAGPPSAGWEDEAASGPAGLPLREAQDSTDLEETIRSWQFLAPLSWGRNGWWERQLWQRLNDRERVLVEFAFPNGYAITMHWARVFRQTLIVWLVAALAGLLSLDLQGWAVGLGLLFTGAQAGWLLTRSGAAFRTMFTSGVNLPYYANCGIGYRELGRMLAKCALAQWPGFLVFAVGWGLFLGWLKHWPVGATLVFSSKLAWLALAARFIVLVTGFSAGSNDTSRCRWSTVCLVIVVGAFALAFLGLAVGALFLPSAPLAWACCALALPDAWLMFVVYGWFHNTMRFDLVSLPR